ncbi:cobalt/nickel transport system permease protein [Haloplanus vescus]|uniref:Cobalt/nickel transport system permease protein n=1 Tax=Haloplanus vescus TaxID=555874 RepID=A0A1H3YI65_9EURY|nr:cobalt ECF transporter T component CbiQ [Haloplanus vescus]SEA11245.1 cobalt/nickel transport system permease protein [Haloplanus vescus]
MHRTLEDVQVDATPAVEGPLRVYVVLAALVLTATTTRTAVYVAAFATFALLSVHAVGRAYVAFLGYPLSFLVPSLLLVALVTPGDPVVELWILALSDRGLDLAATTGLRAMASLSVLSFLALTTTVPQLVAALDDLHLPDPVVELLLLVYRGIQVLVGQATRRHTAARLRGGFDSRRNLFRTTKLVAASLLVSSVDRAEAFETAMNARNYAGRMPVPDYESGGYAVAGVALSVLVAARWVV